jgi:hypothetical protein
MANKAFVVFNDESMGGGPGGSGVVSTRGVVLDPGGNMVGTAGCTVNFHYSDSSQSINELVADKLREINNDPSLVVIFLGSPGRY